MRDFSRKKRISRFLYSRFAFAALFIAVVFAGNAAWNAYGRYQNAEGQTAIVARELAALTDRQEELSRKIELLETTEGIEAELRSRFGVAKEGEHIIVILDEEEGSGAVAEQGSRPMGFWETVKEWFR